MRDGKQKGFVLLEAAVSLPMLVLLLTAAGTMVLWSIKNYFLVMADAELQQEVGIAFQRVVEHALEAERIVPNHSEEKGYDICKREFALPPSNWDNKPLRRTFWLHNMEGTRKLVDGIDASAPMTGDSAMAEASIQDFSCQAEPGHEGLYVIRLQGVSERTGHVYTLQTAVYLPPDRK